MRTIEYKKSHSPKHRRKVICINEHNEDKDCKTQVHKSFVYHVSRGGNMTEALADPQIYIRKHICNKTFSEGFFFKVKGAFFLTRDRVHYKVNFCHALRIGIQWKNKIFSPNKSVTLT